MAKTEFIHLQGKAKWVRCQTPDPWGNFKMTLYPNSDALQKIQELIKDGLKNVLRKDEDGYNVTFRRPTSKLIRGKVVGFAAPTIVEADGKSPLRDVLVGNGSDVTITLEVYGFKTPQGSPGKAARLSSIRVDNLIPFEMKRDLPPGGDQEQMVTGLADVPVPT